MRRENESKSYLAMASITEKSSLKDYQNFVNEVYGPGNKRHFSVDDMLTNVSRFAMRGLKGIRKGDNEKLKLNMIIAISWFFSLMNQLGLDIERSVWNRFPYACSYCGECPCACMAKKIQKRVTIKADPKKHPKTIGDFQTMFNDIYPSKSRTLEHAGIHLAEEVGELSEAALLFRGHHTDKTFDEVALEASDLFSCFMGVLNSAGIDFHAELIRDFSDGCHICHKTPCACEYDFVVKFRS